MDPTPGRWGPFWTPITPEAGSLFHAEQHSAPKALIWLCPNAAERVISCYALGIKLRRVPHPAVHRNGTGQLA